MYFKNKTTGLVWRITDESHQERLRADTGYVELSGANTKDAPTEPHNESANESDTMKSDYKSMEWQDLRKLATEKGINTHGKKRVEIEKELGDIDVTDIKQD